MNYATRDFCGRDCDALKKFGLTMKNKIKNQCKQFHLAYSVYPILRFKNLYKFYFDYVKNGNFLSRHESREKTIGICGCV